MVSLRALLLALLVRSNLTAVFTIKFYFLLLTFYLKFIFYPPSYILHLTSSIIHLASIIHVPCILAHSYFIINSFFVTLYFPIFNFKKYTPAETRFLFLSLPYQLTVFCRPRLAVDNDNSLTILPATS